MITCSEAVQQLWSYLEDEVAADDRARIDEHLAFCRRCCGEVEFAEELRGVLASAAEVDLPPDVEARLTGFLDELDGPAHEAADPDAAPTPVDGPEDA
jgi:anti-sigma factor (TIGR02949 family)